MVTGGWTDGTAPPETPNAFAPLLAPSFFQQIFTDYLLCASIFLGAGIKLSCKQRIRLTNKQMVLKAMKYSSNKSLAGVLPLGSHKSWCGCSWEAWERGLGLWNLSSFRSYCLPQNATKMSIKRCPFLKTQTPVRPYLKYPLLEPRPPPSAPSSKPSPNLGALQFVNNKESLKMS